MIVKNLIKIATDFLFVFSYYNFSPRFSSATSSSSFWSLVNVQFIGVNLVDCNRFHKKSPSLPRIAAATNYHINPMLLTIKSTVRRDKNSMKIYFLCQCDRRNKCSTTKNTHPAREGEGQKRSGKESRANVFAFNVQMYTNGKAVVRQKTKKPWLGRSI